MPDPISVVIPFRLEKNSHELRFALRSIQKHLGGYGEIWLIGDAPDWIRNVRRIPMGDSQNPRRKEENIYRKILAGIFEDEITDQFAFWNDDHYLLADTVARDFPCYTHRTLREGQLQNNGDYRTTLIRTERLLTGKNLGILDFDCHCPIVYDKSLFIEAFAGVEWRDWGYAIKSIYCNSLGVEGVRCEDLKLTGRKIKEMQNRIRGRSWFSTGSSNPIMEQFLAGLYPRKSRYEK